jgi:acyl carrier protein
VVPVDASEGEKIPLPEPAPNRAAVLGIVRSCIAESLAIKEEKIELTSRLHGDLHADSLDFVEMLFSFEREFSLPLQEEIFNRLMRSDYEDENLSEEGNLPAEDLAALEPWFPVLREVKDKTRIAPRQLFEYLTVESLVLMIEKEQSKGTEAQ